MSDWKKVTGELGQMVRWTEAPKDAMQAEKTIYVGNVIEGVYERRSDGIGKNNASIYNVRTKEHGLLGIWDTTVLADRMKEVQVGSEVQITCLGPQVPKKGGAEYVGFDVLYRDPPMKVAGQGAVAPEDVADDQPQGTVLPPM